MSPQDPTLDKPPELAFVVKADERRGYGVWLDGEWHYPFHDGAPGTRLDAIELLHALAIKQAREREARDAELRG